MSAEPVEAPAGFAVGHHTDRRGWTGCTVILPPAGAVAAAEVRGGGPGTRESDLLSPAANAPGINALLLTGGSAFGLAAADGVVRRLEERGIGYPTRVAAVPLVSAAVVYDLALGDAGARPRPDDAYAACDSAAGGAVERGSVGAGTGCSVGKVLGMEHATKAGLGAAALEVGSARLVAIAVVNAAGDVLAEDGRVLAGVWRDGAYRRTVDLLAGGLRPAMPVRENTVLVALLTDARLDKRQAWLVARAGTSGVARAVDPSATPVDGDMVACLASGDAEADPFVLSACAPEVTARAIRDAVRRAEGAPGCPSATERALSSPRA